MSERAKARHEIVLLSRSRRYLEFQISKLNVHELREMLRERRCSTHGAREVLRDRLLHAQIYAVELGISGIPGCSDNEARDEASDAGSTRSYDADLSDTASEFEFVAETVTRAVVYVDAEPGDRPLGLADERAQLEYEREKHAQREYERELHTQRERDREKRARGEKERARCERERAQLEHERELRAQREREMTKHVSSEHEGEQRARRKHAWCENERVKLAQFEHVREQRELRECVREERARVEFEQEENARREREMLEFERTESARREREREERARRERDLFEREGEHARRELDQLERDQLEREREKRAQLDRAREELERLKREREKRAREELERLERERLKREIEEHAQDEREREEYARLEKGSLSRALLARQKQIVAATPIRRKDLAPRGPARVNTYPGSATSVLAQTPNSRPKLANRLPLESRVVASETREVLTANEAVSRGMHRRRGVRRDKRRTRHRESDSRSSEGASSDSTSASSASSRRKRGRRGGRRVQTVRILRKWRLRFAGEDREVAEGFLKQLHDCRSEAKIADREMLSALPCVLQRQAMGWFRANKRKLREWHGFVVAFKNHFIGECDHEDLVAKEKPERTSDSRVIRVADVACTELETRQSARTSARSAPSSSSNEECVGPCFVCRAVGHRAVECSEIRCFGCKERGHSRRMCSRARISATTCQGCGAANVTVRSCSNCGPLFTKQGNNRLVDYALTVDPLDEEI